MTSTSKTPPTAASGDFRNVSFSGRFVLENAADIREKLLEAIAASSRLTLDISAVTEIDLIGLQIICSLHRTAQEQGVIVQLANPLPEKITVFARQAGFPRLTACYKGLNNFCVWSGHHGPAS